jgi:hypothetical protein
MNNGKRLLNKVESLITKHVPIIEHFAIFCFAILATLEGLGGGLQMFFELHKQRNNV